MLTVKRQKIGGNVYRLANFGYARGFAIQVMHQSGKRYDTIEHLGWMHEDGARAFFQQFCEFIRRKEDEGK